MKKLTFVGILPVAAIILAAFLPLCNAEACTSMFWNTNGKVMLDARNMDYGRDDQPVFYVFPRGINKNGGVDLNSATWTSQYGSLMVTHLGLSTFSTEGMNEAGLSFHSQYLGVAQYEPRNYARPGVLQGRLGIYLLDNSATVSDALKLMFYAQVVPELFEGEFIPQHYALRDASGDAAVVEFVGGEMKVYHGSEYTVLSNDPPFDQQIPNLWKYQYFGGTLTLPGDLNAKDRFVRASAFRSSLDAAFTNQALKPTPLSGILTAILALTEPFGGVQYIEGVDAPVPVWPTLWTIIHDLTNKATYFRHNMAMNNYWIDMKKLNFQSGAPIRSLNAERPDLSGEVSMLFTSPAPTSSLMLLLSD